MPSFKSDRTAPKTSRSEAESHVLYLEGIRETLSRKSETAAAHLQSLVFLHPPRPNSIPATSHRTSDLSPEKVNTGAFALKRNSSSNSPVLSYEDWLLQVLDEVGERVHYADDLVSLQARSLVASLEEAFLELETWKADEWERQRLQATMDNLAATVNRNESNHVVDTAQFFHPVSHCLPPGLLAAYLLVAVLHLLCAVSIIRSRFVMACFSAIMSACCSCVCTGRGTDEEVDRHSNIAKGVPSDVRGVLGVLNLDPATKEFVCCQDCFSLYPIADDGQFQERCTYKRTNDSAVCGQDLRATRNVKGRRKQYPCRKFICQDFHDWLGRLLCRPGMEELMDRTVQESPAEPHQSAADIWEAPVFHTIKLRDGSPFLDRNTDEGRYAFSICIDGFNPHGKGGPSVSVGSIFFVCLNLPPHLRYRYENMYLAAVIPGPKHPSKEQINNILGPVLRPFHESYKSGIYYTRTPCRPNGKKTTSIVVPLVSDTVAAHQVNGNAPHTHTWFCPYCKISLSEIENLDYNNWPMRTCAEHSETARQWLLAETAEQRTAIYEKEGVRWSELLALPYWDPIRLMAIDPMHNLYLGVLKHHVENVWGMDSEIDDGTDGITNDPLKRRATRDELEDARRIVRYESSDILDSLKLHVLRPLAKELGVERWGTSRTKIVRQLIALRVAKGWFNESDECLLDMPANAQSTPERPASFEQALLDVKSKSRTFLEKTYKKPVLAYACAELLGDTVARYLKESKTTLLDLIDSYNQDQDELSEDDHSEVVLDPGPEAETHVPNPQRDDEYTKAHSVLYTGTKTRLRELPIARLISLCSREIGPPDAPWAKMKKPMLLEKLFQFRITNRITDEAGKLLQASKKPQHAQTHARTQSVPLTSKSPEPITVQNERWQAKDQVTETELAEAEKLVEYGSKAKLKKIRPAVLAVLCARKFNTIVEAKRQAVMEVIDNYRRTAGIVDERGRITADRRQKLRNRVLGKQTLQHVWTDMKNMQAPSWLTRAPSAVGTSGHGSLGADEWRTFCTLNLPVTLVAQWGLKPADSRERLLLDNFMDLVGAVQVASMRVTTADRRVEFRFRMHRYLQTLLKLFPGTTLVPNHHKALHLPEVLEFLGPAHAIWCYGFERGNFELQKINTNNRIYELASTMLLRFCYKQNLRHLFSIAVLPRQLKTLIQAFNRSFERENRGSLFNDMSPPDSMEMFDLEYWQDKAASDPCPDNASEEDTHDGGKDLLDRDIEDVLRRRLIEEVGEESPFNRYVTRCASCEDGGVFFKSIRLSPGDSNIIFRRQDDLPTVWRPGRLRDIFFHSSRRRGARVTQLYLAVDEFRAVDPEIATLEPFRRYGLRAGALFLDQYETTPYIITKNELLCHCTCQKPNIVGLQNSQQYVVIQPLNKY